MGKRRIKVKNVQKTAFRSENRGVRKEKIKAEEEILDS
jgi:hypothetical protein